MAESKQAWQKREKESVQAYEAFSTYLLLGPDRSLNKTRTILGKNMKLIAKWSVKHGWVLRVAAYEEHYTLTALDATEDERIALLREHLVLSTSVLRRARARLEHAVEVMPEPTGDAVADAETLEELASQGKLLSIDQALRAADLAVRVGRLATGLDGKYVPPGAGTTDISNLDEDELDRLESLLGKAKG